MRCRSCCSAHFHIHGVVKLFSPQKQCYSHFGSYFCCFCNLLCLHLHLCSVCMDTVCQLPFSSSSFLFSFFSSFSERPTAIHAHIHTYSQFRSSSYPYIHVFGLGEEDWAPGGNQHTHRTRKKKMGNSTAEELKFKQETVVSLSRFFQSLSIIWENEENTITQ